MAERTPTSCTMTMVTDSLEGPLHVVATLGVPFRVVGPPELRDLVADWGRRFADAV